MRLEGRGPEAAPGASWFSAMREESIVRRRRSRASHHEEHLTHSD